MAIRTGTQKRRADIHALLTTGEMTDEEAVRHGLAGNLCRCTGYRAIVDAASELAGVPTS